MLKNRFKYSLCVTYTREYKILHNIYNNFSKEFLEIWHEMNMQTKYYNTFTLS